MSKRHRFLHDNFSTNAPAIHRCIDECFSQGGKWEVVISPYKKNKSDEQRDYWHKCLRVLGDETGNTLEYMKCYVKDQCGMCERTTNNDGKVLCVYKSSEKLSMEDYSMLINKTHELAAFVGCVLPHPDDQGRVA